MADKKISQLTAKGSAIAANDLIEASIYVSPGVYATRSVRGDELGGVSAFTELTDVPASYTGQTLKYVRVNAGETALEFVNAPTSSTGRFGIADSNGAYTYYTTLTLAMAAATSGQTIEFFTDYTETGAVSITLKDGVTINGNGHTYTLNVAGVTNAFNVAASATVTCSILNLTVIRTGSTSVFAEGNCLNIGANSTSDLTLTGSIFKNTGSGNATYLNGTSTKIYGGSYISTFDSIYSANNSAKIYNVIATSSSTGSGIKLQNGGSVYFSIGTGTGTGSGIYANGAYEVVNSVGIAVSGAGIFGGILSNCTGLSISGNGIEGTSGSKIDCSIGRSVSGYGIFINGCSCYNSISTSSSSYGGRIANASTVVNTLFESTSNFALWNSNGTTAKLTKCTIKSLYNNSAGYGILGSGGALPAEIHNCKFDLIGGVARYIQNSGVAANVEMVGNIYKGGTIIDPAIVQTAVATEDAQGNIFL